MDIVIVLLSFLLGATIVFFSGGWLEIAMYFICIRQDALWVSLRFQEPFGMNHWSVLVQPLNGPERLLTYSSVRFIAVFRALALRKATNE